ncbi:HupE/UreJ family protein [Saccharophagus sp. K07]|uniref:HupE/UreJ family protein n=1 Tax=Saccharophagus sp. K07 TaxID=2283636 RepID=UPI001652A22F|nr:HupE/UreJ family protein [Saccharophagus sp. K07]
MKKLIAFALVMFPAVALAHPGHHHVDWLDGFLHPLTGLDHLLALVATGLWLAQTQTRHKVGFIGAFIAILAVSIALGTQFSHLTMEAGITATLVVLGGLIACAVKGSMILRTVVVALTAIIHGFVHGTELPAEAAMPFAAGLLASSAMVVVLASWLGHYSQKFAKGVVAQVLGALLVLFGITTAF